MFFERFLVDKKKCPSPSTQVRFCNMYVAKIFIAFIDEDDEMSRMKKFEKKKTVVLMTAKKKPFTNTYVIHVTCACTRRWRFRHQRTTALGVF